MTPDLGRISLTRGLQAYNPHIFLRNPSAPISTANICSVVALGADDRSVSVWQTKSARPLIVAKEVFERQIMDLSWYVGQFSPHNSLNSQSHSPGHGMV